MSEQDITRLGSEADYILSSEAFKRASEGLETKLIEEWASGAFTTVEQREEAFNRVRAARLFRQQLVAMVDGMKISKARADERAKQRARAGEKAEEG